MEGEFRLVAFRDKLSDSTHLALIRGDIDAARETVVRVHEPVSIVDLLDYGSRAHSWTIPAALARLAQAERAVLVLLHRPESAQELRQRAIGEQAFTDTKMDLRNYWQVEYPRQRRELDAAIEITEAEIQANCEAQHELRPPILLKMYVRLQVYSSTSR